MSLQKVCERLACVIHDRNNKYPIASGKAAEREFWRREMRVRWGGINKVKE
jgi:hypothetical protein